VLNERGSGQEGSMMCSVQRVGASSDWAVEFRVHGEL